MGSVRIPKKPPFQLFVPSNTGAGEAKPLTHDAIANRARVFQMERMFWFLGSEAGHGVRLYVQGYGGWSARGPFLLKE